MIDRLARLSDIAFGDDAPSGSIQDVVGETTIILPLADVIDLDQEKARLQIETVFFWSGIGALGVGAAMGVLGVGLVAVAQPLYYVNDDAWIVGGLVEILGMQAMAAGLAVGMGGVIVSFVLRKKVLE